MKIIYGMIILISFIFGCGYGSSNNIIVPANPPNSSNPIDYRVACTIKGQPFVYLYCINNILYLDYNNGIGDNPVVPGHYDHFENNKCSFTVYENCNVTENK